MIKRIIQKDLFEFTEVENQSHDSALNMITGHFLMEVYYWAIPVFRCNMGLSIEDDHFFCRIKYKDSIAIISQAYSDVKRRCGKWQPDEVFATHAIYNFCQAFNVPYAELHAHLESRRTVDSLTSKKPKEEEKYDNRKLIKVGKKYRYM